MYADDTTLYAAAETVKDLSKMLDEELKMVVNWIEGNQLILKVQKTKSIIIGSKSSLKG